MIAKATPTVVPAARQMKYYDLKKNWRRVKPHLSDKKLNNLLVRDFSKFTIGRWNLAFTQGDLPSKFESPDCWRHRRGRRPAFWDYVKSGACHWLVNFTLRLATLVMPERQWRIITSKKHSTVWDGKDTIFDFNWQAFGADANDCFEKAYGQELAPGKYLKMGFAPYYGDEQETNETALKHIAKHFQCDRELFESVEAIIAATPSSAQPSIVFCDAERRGGDMGSRGQCRRYLSPSFRIARN